MGRLFFEHLDGRRYSCRSCGCHLAKVDELVSRQFHSKSGKAYLFNTVVNVHTGPEENRLMTTGAHVVSDIHCNGCMEVIGWKYWRAAVPEQRYKEGKFILERARINDLACASNAIASAACPYAAHGVDVDSDSDASV